MRECGARSVNAQPRDDALQANGCGGHLDRGTDTIGTAQIVNPGPAPAGHHALVEVDGQVQARLD